MDIKHPHFEITAQVEYWSALGFEISTDYETKDKRLSAHSIASSEFDELLILALAEGHTDARAVAWAIGEKQRRREEKTRVTAMAREAEGLSALAAAIREETRGTAIDSVLSSLTERTRWAVRKQAGL